MSVIWFEYIFIAISRCYDMNRDSLPHRGASAVLVPFRHLPSDKRKDKLRAAIWSVAGAGIVSKRAHLPRDDLLIDSNDTVILVGCQRPKRIESVLEVSGPDGTVVIIEPNPTGIETLRKHNTSSRVKFIEAAVWNEESDDLAGLMDDKNRLVQINNERINADGYNVVNGIRAEPLDSLLPDWICPDYVEVLVNGSEPFVLEGCLDELEKSQARILLKNFGYKSNHRSTSAELTELLSSIGYKATFAPGRIFSNRIEGNHPDGDILAQPR